MKSPHRKTARDLQSLCAELRPEDGISPAILKKQELREHLREHPPSQARSWQYCKAVHRSLEGALASVCGDERLKDLTILAVEPRPAGSSLLVIVAVPLSGTASLQELEQILQNAAGLLRSVIATQIQRKRTPHLTFRAVPAP